ncbi:MAG TPA: pectate lyase [bacterium]|nr:pectate lyase [bacterium]HQP97350.1 pectate lyase [bacterium]
MDFRNSTLLKSLSSAIGAFLVLISICVQAASTGIVAFPGAEGFGKYTVGGRGGDVYHVVNLSDSGPGSLRTGIDSATSPRTIVFDVGGTITLKTPLEIHGKSCLTIAGQTAPGKGITLREHKIDVRDSREIIIRYLRVRLGDENKGPHSQEDVMTVDKNDRIILDHLSLSWGIDGNSDYRSNSNMTLQWILYSEALNASLHDKGDHAMCTSLRDCMGNTTVHHNIYSTSRDRHPTLGSGVNSTKLPDLIVDFRNCLNYNWSGPTNLGGLKMNIVGNYYRPGPCTNRKRQAMQMKDGNTEKARGYMRGNRFEGMPDEFDTDNYTAVDYSNTGKYMSTTREQWQVPSEFNCGEFSLDSETAEEAYKSCLEYAGCLLVRDTVDERVIRNIVEQTGEIIDSQRDVGGWDPYPEEHRPDSWDTDRDGIADTWETANGLNPKEPGDGNGDRDADGYTNLEEYINSLCPTPR